ncbi:kinesin-like protein [Kipferlia bialata]|uniref:Kinesin-like protein n=1 Tax=Kipferlia bialata TaxID=797122 RepID=A0A9K3CNM5_9EUKA|nr:kinesin-like protein [Kipferlia bialata]|eukprot:g1223.t1
MTVPGVTPRTSHVRVPISLRPRTKALTRDTAVHTSKMKILCRVRPELDGEMLPGQKGILGCEEGSGRIVITEPDSIEKKGGSESFTFTQVLQPSADNAQCYEAVADEAQKMTEGVSLSVMAYGITGSGKTHTIQGTKKDEGILPRLLEHIFSTVRWGPGHGDPHTPTKRTPGVRTPSRTPRAGGKVERRVRISVLELYCNSCYDLLADVPKKAIKNTRTVHEVYGATDVGEQVASAKSVLVTSYSSCMRVYKAALKRRREGATRWNLHSSRSHLVTRVSVMDTVVNDKGHETEVLFCRASLFDLAGSEEHDAEATDRTNKEGSKIRLSLLSLGKVLEQLKRGEKGRPVFRESLLTRLLQPHLSPESKMASTCVMFLNVHGHPKHHSSTKAAMKLASVSQEIRLKGTVARVTSVRPDGYPTTARRTRRVPGSRLRTGRASVRRSAYVSRREREMATPSQPQHRLALGGMTLDTEGEGTPFQGPGSPLLDNKISQASEVARSRLAHGYGPDVSPSAPHGMDIDMDMDPDSQMVQMTVGELRTIHTQFQDTSRQWLMDRERSEEAIRKEMCEQFDAYMTQAMHEEQEYSGAIIENLRKELSDMTLLYTKADLHETLMRQERDKMASQEATLRHGMDILQQSVTSLQAQRRETRSALYTTAQGMETCADRGCAQKISALEMSLTQLREELDTVEQERQAERERAEAEAASALILHTQQMEELKDGYTSHIETLERESQAERERALDAQAQYEEALAELEREHEAEVEELQTGYDEEVAEREREYSEERESLQREREAERDELLEVARLERERLVSEADRERERAEDGEREIEALRVSRGRDTQDSAALRERERDLASLRTQYEAMVEDCEREREERQREREGKEDAVQALSAMRVECARLEDAVAAACDEKEEAQAQQQNAEESLSILTELAKRQGRVTAAEAPSVECDMLQTELDTVNDDLMATTELLAQATAERDSALARVGAKEREVAEAWAEREVLTQALERERERVGALRADIAREEREREREREDAQRQERQAQRERERAAERVKGLQTQVERERDRAEREREGEGEASARCRDLEAQVDALQREVQSLGRAAVKREGQMAKGGDGEGSDPSLVQSLRQEVARLSALSASWSDQERRLLGQLKQTQEELSAQQAMSRRALARGALLGTPRSTQMKRPAVSSSAVRTFAPPQMTTPLVRGGLNPTPVAPPIPPTPTSYGTPVSMFEGADSESDASESMPPITPMHPPRRQRQRQRQRMMTSDSDSDSESDSDSDADDVVIEADDDVYSPVVQRQRPQRGRGRVAYTAPKRHSTRAAAQKANERLEEALVGHPRAHTSDATDPVYEGSPIPVAVRGGRGTKAKTRTRTRGRPRRAGLSTSRFTNRVHTPPTSRDMISAAHIDRESESEGEEEESPEVVVRPRRQRRRGVHH